MLLTGKTIGQQEIADGINAALKSLDKVAGLDGLPEKREVHITYRGWKARRVVRSVPEEIEVNLVASARGQAVCMGTLPPLPGEKDLCAPAKEEETSTVKEQYVKHSRNARLHVESLVQTHGSSNGEQLLDLFFFFLGLSAGLCAAPGVLSKNRGLL